MLKDAFGRSFSYLRLSVTDSCNYRCNYCLPDGMPPEQNHRLGIDQIAMLASCFAKLGIRKVRITGGEPSIRRDLPDIIRILKRTPGIEKVALTTNGHKMERYLTQWRQAGLNSLNVSCDGLDARLFESITGHDAFEKLIESINLARTMNFDQVKINTVLLRNYNLNHLDHFFDWVKKTGITLRFIELMETGDNAEYFQQNHVSATAVERMLADSGWTLSEPEAYAGPAREFVHPEHQGKIGFIAPYSKDFCNTCNRLRISSQGKLHLCLFGESGYDLNPWLKTGDAAGLEDYVADILQQKPVSHFLHDNKTGATTQLATLGG